MIVRVYIIRHTCRNLFYYAIFVWALGIKFRSLDLVTSDSTCYFTDCILQIIEQSEPQKRFLSIYGNQSFGVSSHLQLSALAEMCCFTFSIFYYFLSFLFYTIISVLWKNSHFLISLLQGHSCNICSSKCGKKNCRMLNSPIHILLSLKVCSILQQILQFNYSHHHLWVANSWHYLFYK